MKFFKKFFCKQEKEIIKKENKEKIKRDYNKEIVEVYFSEVYNISKQYIKDYLSWTIYEWSMNLMYSKSIKIEVENVSDFEYYSIIKKHFEKDFKNYLEYIKDKYKPWTSCRILKNIKKILKINIIRSQNI